MTICPKALDRSLLQDGKFHIVRLLRNYTQMKPCLKMFPGTQINWIKFVEFFSLKNIIICLNLGQDY